MNIDIPLLTADDIDCRVQQCKKNKRGEVGAVLLLYKDARVDMRILDQLFGVGGWQRTHEVINGNLFCNIDIWDSDKNCWIRKQDVGVESNTEKEKGQASDSFKRAGTNVGIGRELYTSPFIYVTLKPGEYSEYQGKYKCNAHFKVSAIEYNERREIKHLIIRDDYGNQRFSCNINFTSKAADPRPAAPPEDDMYKPTHRCESCGSPLLPYKDKNGIEISVERHIAQSQKKFGKTLCLSCIQFEKSRQEKLKEINNA